LPVDLRNRLTFSASVSGNRCVSHGRNLIDALNPAGKLNRKDRPCSRHQVVAALAIGEHGQAVNDFSLREGRGEQGRRRLNGKTTEGRVLLASHASTQTEGLCRGRSFRESDRIATRLPRHSGQIKASESSESFMDRVTETRGLRQLRGER
jgi:hypothetical protein